MVLTALATTVLISLATQGVSSAAQGSSNSITSKASASATGSVTQNRYPQFGESNSDVVRLQQAMIVRGFIEPIARELPMEYALELNRLIELQMEGAVG